MAKSEGGDNTLRHPNDLPWLLRVVTDHTQPRSVKEAALARIRLFERQDGREYYGRYNGDRIDVV